MDKVDSEFGPLRKSKGKVDSNKIIDDIKVDHEQSNILKNISLIPIKRNSEDTDYDNKDGDISNNLKKSKVTTNNMDQENEATTKKDMESSPSSLISNTHANVESDFMKLKEYLLKQIYHTLPLPDTHIFTYLKDTESEIDRILKQSIIQKESHSCILIGPRKSYKSFLLNHQIKKLSENYKQQFITIKLNGFIHSESTAIKGIATQLENQLYKIHGRKKDKKKSEEEEEATISSGSLTEVFEKILRVLDTSKSSKHSSNTKITVVFIFDEIDTFAGPVRQTLLYNLFDMVEHSRVPVCIFGCTTKLNILEYFEKRVKSRFSQRILYMPQIESLQQFTDTTEELLKVHKLNAFEYSQQWNTFISGELKNGSSPLSKLVKKDYELYNSIVHLRHSLVPTIFRATSFSSLCEYFKSYNVLNRYDMNQMDDSLVKKISSLSDLELAFLISIARVSLRSRDETFNFNLAYAEYVDMIKILNAKIPTLAPSAANGKTINFDNTTKIWSKNDLKNVWESLISLNFLTEKGDLGLRETAIAVFYASNYQFHGSTIPFDLRIFQSQVTLHELRKTIPKSSLYYSWTQL
ncbi:hypothetical protein Kpol_1008p15 [Vanderwaltozyma polyspora DSM 70294]|uniref:Origin recognition complex subunit 4 C-terminal domain-containing protein n=1 Tax=Vanderwaltozyma polyspora (strain ATCC 22028 / DSM 70294 / BCRC 21397 / CBS 2163 / NBRC 10782 / NRRL Y-8283 / UCD 57-17) TaxID=436907 RepID=A7TPX9_VANPO|nr:uncharacterized protein Kpol_1008p15 [Vanderwaltozyma polyspora DSM 70294]EDO15677.1 hypothetical protein Kpol_1008p15 [Vanderwaltozyma polyspora DSM 70294]